MKRKYPSLNKLTKGQALAIASAVAAMTGSFAQDGTSRRLPGKVKIDAVEKERPNPAGGDRGGAIEKAPLRGKVLVIPKPHPKLNGEAPVVPMPPTPSQGGGEKKPKPKQGA